MWFFLSQKEIRFKVTAEVLCKNVGHAADHNAATALKPEIGQSRPRHVILYGYRMSQNMAGRLEIADS